MAQICGFHFADGSGERFGGDFDKVRHARLRAGFETAFDAAVRRVPRGLGNSVCPAGYRGGEGLSVAAVQISQGGVGCVLGAVGFQFSLELDFLQFAGLRRGIFLACGFVAFDFADDRAFCQG